MNFMLHPHQFFLTAMFLVAALSGREAFAQNRDFTILKSTDLVGNDYRNPHNTPGLLNIGTEGCKEACRRDTGCRAFTYNVRAGWCWLKSGKGRAKRFRGAISGVKQSHAIPIATSFREGDEGIQFKDNAHPLSTQCQRVFEEWKAKSGFAVFASSRDGACGWAQAYPSPFSAGEAAVKNCWGATKSHRDRRSCKIYATKGMVIEKTAVESVSNAEHKITEGDITQGDMSVPSSILRTAANQSPVSFGSDCKKNHEASRGLSDSVSLVFERYEVKVGAGIPVTLDFNPSKERFPVYLVLSFDQPVRAKGTGFYILSSGAKAPFLIRHAKSKQRLIVPLHIKSSAKRRRFEIKPVVPGQLTVSATIVSAGTCGEKIVKKFPDQTIDTRPGMPEILVADDYSLRRPEKIIMSPSKERKIYLYNGDAFRLVNAQTGQFLKTLAGKLPRFSPTGRFFAFIDQGALEIRDALDGEVVRRDESVDALAWDNDDSFAIMSGIGAGLITVVCPYFEKGDTLASSALGPRAFSGLGTSSAKIDLENNVFLSGVEGTTEAYAESLTEPLFYDFNLLKNIENNTYQTATTVKGKEYKDIELIRLKHKYKSARQFIEMTSQLTDVKFPVAISSSGPKPIDWVFAEKPQFTHLYITMSENKEYLKNVADMPYFSYLVQPHYVPLSVYDNENVVVTKSDISFRERALSRIKKPALQVERSVSNRLDALGLKLEKTFPFQRQHKGFVPAGFHTNAYGAKLPVYQFRSDKSFRIVEDDHCLGGDAEAERADRNRTITTRDAAIWSLQTGDRKMYLFGGGCDGGSAGFTRHAIRLFDSVSPKRLQHVESTVPYYKLLNPGGVCPGDECDYHVVLSHNRYLLIWSKDQAQIDVYDIKTHRTFAFKAYRGDSLYRVALTQDARTLLQFNEDGTFALHQVSKGTTDNVDWTDSGIATTPERTVVLYGLYADDELVVWTRSGYFDATKEGATFAKLRFRGLPGRYNLQQFDRRLRVKGLIEKVLGGWQSKNNGWQDASIPPTLKADWMLEKASGSITASFSPSYGSKVQSISIFQDGLLTNDLRSQNDGTIRGVFNRLPGARWVSAVAVDDKGLVSLPMGGDLGADAAHKTRLHFLTVGIDEYRHAKPLSFAVYDADSLAASLQKSAGRSYEIGFHKILRNDDANRETILAKAEEIVRQAHKGDTIVFSFAGHGMKGADGKFYLATGKTDPAHIHETGLAWDDLVGIFKNSEARIVVFLDACHSGAAGTDESAYSTNDQVVNGLLAGMPPGLVVFAASKGREKSEESAGSHGGVFTSAVTDVIANKRNQYDINKNGAIEISELYFGVKKQVVERTSGRQTPWLARNLMVGDFALF